MRMKILLDEHLPYALARSFPDNWDIRSTQRMGWKGKENGELLQLAAARGFDALITADRNMPRQQNRNAPLPVVVLRASSLRVQDLQPLVMVSGCHRGKVRKGKRSCSWNTLPWFEGRHYRIEDLSGGDGSYAERLQFHEGRQSCLGARGLCRKEKQGVGGGLLEDHRSVVVCRRGLI